MDFIRNAQETGITGDVTHNHDGIASVRGRKGRDLGMDLQGFPKTIIIQSEQNTGLDRFG